MALSKIEGQGVEERRLRRMINTPQGEVIEDNTADDILMVDQDLKAFMASEINSSSI